MVLLTMVYMHFHGITINCDCMGSKLLHMVHVLISTSVPHASAYVFYEHLHCACVTFPREQQWTHHCSVPVSNGNHVIAIGTLTC